MRKFIIAAIICIATSGIASAHKGQFSLGGNVVYGTCVSNIGLGVKGQYEIINHLRAEASFNYYFKNSVKFGNVKSNYYMWEFNANAHYVIPLSSKFDIYPLAGITVANLDNADDKAYHAHTKVGANLGAGVDFNLNSHVSLNFAVKYTLISDLDQAVFGLGAVYHF